MAKKSAMQESDGEMLVELLRRLPIDTFNVMVRGAASHLTTDEAQALCQAFKEFKA